MDNLQNNLNIIQEMIEYFLSDKFKFDKKNLNYFFNELHKEEYVLLFDKKFKVAFYCENDRTYKEMVDKGSAQFCDARRDYRIQTMKILFNTKENDLLHKLRILIAYFHECEHERQLDNICSKFKKNISDYEHLIKHSYIWGQELYHSEIIEIEAIIGSINKLVNVLNNNKNLINKFSIYALICEMLELENCLNYFENEEVFKTIYKKYGQELKNRGIDFRKFELNSKKIIELHSIEYDNKFLFWRNNTPITISNIKYKEKLQKILDKKITRCFNNAFKVVYKNSLKLFKPNKDDVQTLAVDFYKKIKVSKDKLEIIELLYDNLFDKMENFANETKEDSIEK